MACTAEDGYHVVVRALATVVTQIVQPGALGAGAMPVGVKRDSLVNSFRFKQLTRLRHTAPSTI
jgi:hypothetical protein